MLGMVFKPNMVPFYGFEKWLWGPKITSEMSGVPVVAKHTTNRTKKIDDSMTNHPQPKTFDTFLWATF